MKTVIITGASSGIGLALCLCYIKNNYFVFGSVRTSKDAESLSKILGKNGQALIFDVSKRHEIEKAYKTIYKKTTRVELLINNAGIALPGPLEITTEKDFSAHYLINILGVLNCVQIFLPLLKNCKSLKKPSQIINISTGGGKRGTPFLGAYCMSKHGLEGLSKVLRQEMLIYGIQVVVIAPGSIKTSMWSKGKENAAQYVYQKSEYSEYLKKFQKWLEYLNSIGLSPDLFAEKVFKITQRHKPPVRVVIHPRPFLSLFLQDVLPTRFFNNLYARSLGFPKK